MILKWAMAIFCTAMLARADETTNRLTAAGIADFSAAYQAWDGARFGKSAEMFRQASVRDPESAVFAYWRGAALFHQMLQLKNPPSGSADIAAVDAVMDSAIDVLDRALALDAGNAESHALLGTLYGMKIGGSLLGVIRYGPSVQDHQKKALACGPKNPRVRYLLGTGLLHTAKDRCGKMEALNTLLAAEKLFLAEAKVPPGPFDPRWGYSSCLTFIGSAYEKLGNPSEASTYYHKALTLHPADHMARRGMIRLGEKP